MEEYYMDIPEYEGHYQISNLGNVRSVKQSPFLVLKPMVATNGYLVACLWKDGKQRKRLVHRLVADDFLSNPMGYSDVNHIDVNKTNNHFSNLEWCTHGYNMNYGHVKEKISRATRGKITSAEHRHKLSLDTSRRMWVNDGTIEKYIYRDQIENFIAAGWTTGRLRRRRID